MKDHLKQIMILTVVVATVLTSCEDPEKDNIDPVAPVKIPTDIIENSKQFDLNGQIFSIPSPVQTAILIKESGAEFNEAYLNPKEKADVYSTMFQKATNLGVYGADLGYATIYENTNISLDYLTPVRKLASEVGVENAFNETLIERFSANSTNQDSILVFISEAYQAADNYLKENDKSYQAGLILAGGWIEALHFSCKVAELGNEDVRYRIGEQKSTLKSLISLLHSLDVNGDDYEEFVIGMEDLYANFEQVTSEYTYQEPVTYADKKLTVFNSTNTVNMPDDVLSNISMHVSDLRELIIK
ncbi:MAG: hypothetical protein HOL28_03920 [Crocinitomicaceae bacterium]|mgnify:CR=1 FL=1|jgi:hypothetical protein|nr:hypothetical protein [Crocinitomicaceae bacterium]MBT5402570.1 hypothetical protein [Crocinitomicaceae bacterium]MBT6515965.1 hypothetical protein [Crocinitomicaceae bacterium]MDG2330552.1 hypothetical protein [Flavobacteriales bacterium]